MTERNQHTASDRQLVQTAQQVLSLQMQQSLHSTEWRSRHSARPRATRRTNDPAAHDGPTTSDDRQTSDPETAATAAETPDSIRDALINYPANSCVASQQQALTERRMP